MSFTSNRPPKSFETDVLLMGTISNGVTEILEGLQMSHRALIVLPSKLVAVDLDDEARLDLKIHVWNGDGPIRQ